MIKRISIAAAAMVGLLAVAVSGGILMASQSGDGDGSAAGNTQFVSEVVENIGLEREVVRDAMDRAKLDMDSGAAGTRTFEDLVAEYLRLETHEVEAAIGQARLDTLSQRMDGKLAAVLDKAGTN